MASKITGCQPYRILDRKAVSPYYMTVSSGRRISKDKPTLTKTAPSTSFLDLPAEVRLLIYESIDFPSTAHILDKTQLLITKRLGIRPVGTKSQVYDTRTSLIRPRFPIDILSTCRLIYEEARPILHRKAKSVRIQPVRLTLDYSPVWECIYPAGPSGSHFGRPDAVKDFCGNDLLRTLRNRYRLTAVPTVELHLMHKRDVAYGRESLEVMEWIEEMMACIPIRLVVVYKTPLPDIRPEQRSGLGGSSGLEAQCLRIYSKEKGAGDEAGTRRGIFMRPLGEKAFERHVKGLEWY